MIIFFLILGLSLLIFIHELGHFLAAKKFGLLVEEFGFGFPPRLWGKKIGETTYSINWLPFGGFVKIFGERADASLLGSDSKDISKERSFAHQTALRRAIIIIAGVVMNIALGWVILSGIYMVGAPMMAVITGISPNSPAEIAGFKIGDQLSEFNTVESAIENINAHKGEEINFKIRRGGIAIELRGTPDKNPPEGRGSLGVALSQSGVPQYPFFKALGKGAQSTGFILWSILGSFKTLFVGIFSGGVGFDQFVGPVGIAKVAGEAAKDGVVYFFQLLALISLNLAVLNILPFPALDGGRLFFIFIEKIKGSPISPKKEMIANATGFILLLLLMLVITVRDVAKLF